MSLVCQTIANAMLESFATQLCKLSLPWPDSFGDFVQLLLWASRLAGVDDVALFGLLGVTGPGPEYASRSTFSNLIWKKPKRRKLRVKIVRRVKRGKNSLEYLNDMCGLVKKIQIFECYVLIGEKDSNIWICADWWERFKYSMLNTIIYYI